MSAANNTIMDMLCCGYLTTAQDGRITFANEYLLGLLRTAPEETLIGQYLTDLLPSKEIVYFEAKVFSLLQQGSTAKEISTELLAKDATRVPVLLNVLRVKKDDREVTHYTFFDISQRKQYELELLQASEKQQAVLLQLQESNQRFGKDNSYYKSIIENQSFYIIKTDLEGKYSYMNPYFCLVLGIEEQEWIGRHSLEQILPEDHAACIETVGQCFANPDTMQKVILRKPTANGIIISTQWEFSLLRDEENNISEVLCIGHDITPLIKKQKDLQTLVDITAKQNKRLLDFTYIVSHNIRSHVANLSGILDVTDLDDEEDMKASFGILKLSVGRLDETIHNLNDIISIQDNTNLPLGVLNLKKEIDKVLQIIDITFTSAKASIIYHFTDEEQLYTNPACFESILLNLLTNSIKYKSADRDPVIEIRVEKEGDFKVLTVQDNGLGIDLTRYHDRLFGMYNTFHGNKDAKGLGLFIIKTQIESMKGRIEVESKVDVGTCFKVYFLEQ